jgi:hypothetical protein
MLTYYDYVNPICSTATKFGPLSTRVRSRVHETLGWKLDNSCIRTCPSVKMRRGLGKERQNVNDYLGRVRPLSLRTSASAARKILPFQNARAVRTNRINHTMHIKMTITACTAKKPGMSNASPRTRRVEIHPTFGKVRAQPAAEWKHCQIISKR